MARLVDPAVAELDVGRLVGRGVGFAVPSRVDAVCEGGEAGAGVLVAAVAAGVIVAVTVGEAVGFAFQGAPARDGGGEDGVAGCDGLE